ncbi:PepSY domain-containing protein [Streptosporangium sp. KLBMP 9127]|nr:PepSY domain-containing protein [Streptosporangium sp. KLBMP 9127]
MRTHSRAVLAGAGAAAVLAAGVLTAGAVGAASSPSATPTASSSATTAANATAAANRQISCKTAVKIAKRKAPGARVTDVEREWEHGRRVCKVELQKGRWEYDVYVSIADGKIVKFKKEYDD